MKKKQFGLILFVLILYVGQVFGSSTKQVLIFTKTTGFRHDNIAKGVAVVSKLLNTQGIQVMHTEESSWFNADSLKRFDAVIFLSTTGDIFNSEQKEAFQAFIRGGKGFVGIHAASDTEYNWPWYGALVGGYFSSHPAVQEAKIEVKNRKHISTKHLQRIWFHKDEWYDFKAVKPGLNILMTIDETTYEGGRMGKFHPVAWFQEYDGGRSFYTALGHTKESFDSDNFQQHVLGGVLYALGAE